MRPVDGPCFRGESLPFLSRAPVPIRLFLFHVVLHFFSFADLQSRQSRVSDMTSFTRCPADRSFMRVAFSNSSRCRSQTGGMGAPKMVPSSWHGVPSSWLAPQARQEATRIVRRPD